MHRGRQRIVPFRLRRGAFAAALQGGVFLSVRPALAQCIMCRESLKSGGSEELIQGFMFSTILLTSVPLLLMSAFAFAFYKASRQRQEATLPSNSEGPPDHPERT